MFLLLWFSLLAIASGEDELKVKLRQGVVIGTRATDGDYLSFYGIHYGGTTSGDKRFKGPTDPLAYVDEYHAVNSDIICAQPSPQGIIGIEDCLVLDIHTKNLATPKPVIVWLEGEEYQATSKTLYSFKEFVTNDLVFVTIKYRLSIFGFLCLRVPEAPGNAGLKDVIHSLKWIQSNIRAFGGDPTRVTLLGHGSGAAMVDLITLSPLSRGLVHNAMVLSGSALAPWAMAYDPVGYAEKVGAKWKYSGKTPTELAKFLSTISLIDFSTVLNEFEFYNNTPLFAPCIENANLNPMGTFLADAPIDILRSGNYTDIPYVAGFVDREGTLRAKEAAHNNWLGKMNRNFEDFLTADLAFESREDRLNVSQLIRKFYFGQDRIDMSTVDNFLKYQGDVLVLVPVTLGAIERALTAKSEVRLFEFAYRGTNNSDWAYPQIPLTGVRHGGILNYLFDYDLRKQDLDAKAALLKRIVYLAQTGSVQPPNSVTWTPIDKDLTWMIHWTGGPVAPDAYVFSESLVTNRNREHIDFWKNILNDYYRPPPRSSAENVFCFGILVLVTQIVIKLLQ